MKTSGNSIESYFILDMDSKHVTPLSIEGVNTQQGDGIGSMSATMNYGHLELTIKNFGIPI